MPEAPDLTLYAEQLDSRAGGQRLRQLRIGNPFVLRSVSPAAGEFAGRRLAQVRRHGKWLILAFEEELFALIHLMRLGRLHYKPAGAKLARGRGLAAFDFDAGSLQLSESGRQRRAVLFLARGEAAVRERLPAGIDPLGADAAAFAAALTAGNHTLKRALTDQRILLGLGNAYSDEILHAARLSPFRHTQDLSGAELHTLHQAVREVIETWTRRLRQECAGGWPDKVTAFRPEMAVHGKFGQPCPDCGAAVQRIVYADREMNYCPGCQTGGRIFADRALSRLLKDSFPRSLEELES